MNKSNILGIGIGQAGNILLNEFLERDKRYLGLYLNSAYEDMSDLSNFDYNKNAFIFSGESGSGRDRDKAKGFVKSHLKSLADIFMRYPLVQVITVFFSLDGGTGSGTAPMILQTLRTVCKNKKINVIGVLPDLNNSDDVSLTNTINCWNELMEISHLLDDIKFVDNSKGLSYEEINKKAIDDLDMAYSIKGKHTIGNIDETDSLKVNTEKGYGLVLRLNDGEKTIDDAIDNAIKNTVFALPDSYECNYLGISVREGQYDINKLKDEFEVYKTTYKTYNSKFNAIVMGGCDIPSESIELIKMRLEEIRERNSRRTPKRKMIVDIDSKPTLKKKEIQEEKITYTEDELDKLVDDLENLFS